MIGNYPELERLKPEQKLVLAGELFHQAIAADAEETIDPALIQALEERMEQYRQDPDSGMTWEEVKALARGGGD